MAKAPRPDVYPVTPRDRLLAWVAWAAIRLLAATLRISVEDRSGITRPGGVPGPVIWILWHNRILLAPLLRCRHTPHRHGKVLTSTSREGALLTAVVERFGLAAVRGSSSRRGVPALRELEQALRAGEDLAITPDGPRGPVYRLGPGALRLAQRGDTPLLPVGVECQKCWRLKSWDRFIIPKPFSAVRVIFGETLAVRPTPTAEAFAAETARIEAALAAMTETR